MYKDYGFQIQAFRFILGFSFCLIWIKHGYTVALWIHCTEDTQGGKSTKAISFLSVRV